jgi:hypothetical protein
MVIAVLWLIGTIVLLIILILLGLRTFQFLLSIPIFREKLKKWKKSYNESRSKIILKG